MRNNDLKKLDDEFNENFLDDIPDNEEYQFKPKRLRKVIVAVVILMLISVSFFLFHTYQNNPIKLTAVALKRIKSNVTEVVSNYNFKSIDKFTMDGKVDFNIKPNLDNVEGESLKKVYQEFVDIFNDSKIDFQYGINYLENQYYGNISLKSGDNDPINLSYIYDKSRMYIHLKDLYDKYIEYKLDEEVSVENEVPNISYLYDKVTESFIKSLKKEYFVISQTKVKVDGKNKSVNKYELKIDKKVYLEIAQKVKEDLKKDKKVMSILKQLEIELDDQIEVENFETITINIYLGKLNFKLFKIETVTNTTVVEYTNDKEPKLTIKDEEALILNVVFIENKIKMSFFEENKEIINCSIELKGDEMTLMISLSDGSNRKLIFDILLKEKENTATARMIFKIYENNKEVIEMRFGIEGKYEQKFTMPKIINTIKPENMTETELFDIFTKINERINFEDFQEAVMNYYMEVLNANNARTSL